MKRIFLIILSLFIGFSLKAQIFLPAMQGVQYRSGISVTTMAVTNNTTGYSLTSGATIVGPSGAITVKGICWSTNPGPTISNNRSTNGSGAGTFSYTITGLNPGITYYIRGYATAAGVTTYGNEQMVTTLPIMNFAYTGSTQTFTVPAGVTSVTIEAYGAEGGMAPGAISSNIRGGKGAYMKGTCTVAAGDVLTILVGGQGQTSPTAQCGGGGGGGTWVVKSGSLMLVAGGGGGAFCSNSPSSPKTAEGGPGEVTQNGGDGIQAPQTVNSVGTGGSGGQGGYSYFGGGGGGWLSDGTSGYHPTTGGKKYPGAAVDGGGGYGGGGGGTLVCNGSGGGGGGYSGGSVGAYQGSYNAGGGGGSYINGTLVDSARGGATGGGHGKVIITWQLPPVN